MTEILELLGKIYPLYLLIALGFLLGRRWQKGRKLLAYLIIYVIGPLVFFHGAATAPNGHDLIAVPVLFYLLCTVVSMISRVIGRKTLRNKEEADLLAFMGGTGNMGSFGIPVVIAFFGEHMVSVAVCGTIANIIFENTVGYYILVKGRSSARAAIRKVLALPAMYAFALGVFLNLSDAALPVGSEVVFGAIRLSLVVAGMLLIGLSLAAVTRAKLDPRFTAAAFSIKFLIFPAAMLAVLALDRTLTHVFDAQTARVLTLLSVMPVGSNLIAFATKLHKRPELVGFTVLATTIFALGYLPVFAAFFL